MLVEVIRFFRWKLLIAVAGDFFGDFLIKVSRITVELHFCDFYVWWI